jgi:hypothetical protein
MLIRIRIVPRLRFMLLLEKPRFSGMLDKPAEIS